MWDIGLWEFWKPRLIFLKGFVHVVNGERTIVTCLAFYLFVNRGTSSSGRSNVVTFVWPWSSLWKTPTPIWVDMSHITDLSWTWPRGLCADWAYLSQIPWMFVLLRSKFDSGASETIRSVSNVETIALCCLKICVFYDGYLTSITCQIFVVSENTKLFCFTSFYSILRWVVRWPR